MIKNKLLLCTEMDKTVIPSGRQLEHPDARERFREFCSQPNVNLVYVSGWPINLVMRAIVEYNLPSPHFAITDMGTKIYQCHDGTWSELRSWQQSIAAAWGGKSHDDLQQALDSCQELQLQESSKQNDFKLSYSLPLNVAPKQILSWVEQQLAKEKVEFELIWSVDEIERIGQLDILPQGANKKDAIEFLRHLLDIEFDQVFFAGDSGSDLPVLASPIKSVLVANAEPEVRKQAIELSAAYDCSDSLYIAKSEKSPFEGNYAAGVMQGVSYFYPDILK